MKKTVLTAAILATLGLSAGAVGVAVAAGDDDGNGTISPPVAEWISASELSTLLEGEGYDILEMEREDGVWEVEFVDAGGYAFEGEYDAVTGELLGALEADD